MSNWRGFAIVLSAGLWSATLDLRLLRTIVIDAAIRRLSARIGIDGSITGMQISEDDLQLRIHHLGRIRRLPELIHRSLIITGEGCLDHELVTRALFLQRRRLIDRLQHDTDLRGRVRLDSSGIRTNAIKARSRCL